MKIEAALVGYVVRQARHDVWVAPGWGLLLCVVFSGVVPDIGAVGRTEALAVWLAVVSIWAALVGYAFVRYGRSEHDAAAAPHWAKVFCAFYAASGTIWASLIAILWQPDNLLNQLAVLVLGFGVGITMIGEYSAHFRVFVCACMPVFTVLTSMFLLRGDTTGLVLGAVVCLFSFFMLFIGWRSNRVLAHSLQLGFDNAALAADLGRARDEANTALQQAVDERLRAEEASAAKSRFLASVSHELRTPLNAIIGFSDVISRQMLGPLPNRRYLEYANDINSSGLHLLEIISAILDISKIEAGHNELHETTVGCAELLDDCVRLVSEQVSKHQLSRDYVAPDGSLDVRADRVKLRQIVLNLLSNAIKFTPAGGRISLFARTLPDGALEIAVADTGIGMREADIPKALLPFVQLDGAPAGVLQGTGLGLPIVNALVRMHGGFLRIDSLVGAGTTVRVILPPERVRPNADVPATRKSA